MNKSKCLLLIGSLGAAVAGALFAPGIAEAANNCCPSAWSSQVWYPNSGIAECDVVVGGGRVDGEIYPDGPRYVGFWYSATEQTYSPAIRYIIKCNGFPESPPSVWKGGGFWQAGCGVTGYDYAMCQTRLADATYCTGSCD
jgi:hypothetical protein